MKDEMDILEVYRVIYKRKKIVILLFFISVFLTAIVSLILPKTYTSNALIIFTEEESKSLPFSTKYNPFVSDTTGLYKEEVFEIIMKSKNIANLVIKETNLESEYPGSRKEKLIKMLRKSIEIKRTDSPIVKSVVFEANKPVRAYKLLKTYLDFMQEYNNKQQITKSAKTRVFIGQQIEKTRDEIQELDEKLKKFKRENKFLAIESSGGQRETGGGVTGALAGIENQIVQQEMNLRNQIKTKSEFHPDIISIRKALENLYNKYNEALYGYSDSTISDLPDKTVQLERLLIRKNIKNEVYKLLSQEYEKARIDEKKEEISFTVIDPPEIPKTKSKPKRTKMVLISGMVSISLGIILCFILEYYGNSIKPQLKLRSEL